MIETVFAMDEEEMTPDVPQEGGEGQEGGEEAPAMGEPESRLDDGDGEESESDKSDNGE